MDSTVTYFIQLNGLAPTGFSLPVFQQGVEALLHDYSYKKDFVLESLGVRLLATTPSKVAIRFIATIPVSSETRARASQIARDVAHETLQKYGVEVEESIIESTASDPDKSMYRLSFGLWIDPGDASAELVAEVLRALSDVHRASGGAGIRYATDGEVVWATEEECV